ncbi:hypothetical protein CRENBAI_021925 [Crenichthys baileyi]|uniref:Uncharacterized protein n=1 Tax=Crenichthys baileyi TaxID=28760 RepID=A0AAV9QTW5_9TELE
MGAVEGTYASSARTGQRGSERVPGLKRESRSSSSLPATAGTFGTKEALVHSVTPEPSGFHRQHGSDTVRACNSPTRLAETIANWKAVFRESHLRSILVTGSKGGRLKGRKQQGQMPRRGHRAPGWTQAPGTHQEQRDIPMPAIRETTKTDMPTGYGCHMHLQSGRGSPQIQQLLKEGQQMGNRTANRVQSLTTAPVSKDRPLSTIGGPCARHDLPHPASIMGEGTAQTRSRRVRDSSLRDLDPPWKARSARNIDMDPALPRGPHPLSRTVLPGRSPTLGGSIRMDDFPPTRKGAELTQQ